MQPGQPVQPKTAMMYDFDDTLTRVFSLGDGKVNNVVTKACSDNWDNERNAFKPGKCTDQDVLDNLKKGARESIGKNLKAKNPVAIITRNYEKSMIENGYMKAAVGELANQIRYMTWCQGELDKLIAAMQFVLDNPGCNIAVFIDDDEKNVQAISFARAWFESRGIKLRVIHAKKELDANSHLVDTENPKLEFRSEEFMRSNNGSPSGIEILLGFQRKIKSVDELEDKLSPEALLLQKAIIVAGKKVESETKATTANSELLSKTDSINSFIFEYFKELCSIAPNWFPKSFLEYHNTKFKRDNISINATADPTTFKISMSFSSRRGYYQQWSFNVPQYVLLAFAECALKKTHDQQSVVASNPVSVGVTTTLALQIQKPVVGGATAASQQGSGAATTIAQTIVQQLAPF